MGAVNWRDEWVPSSMVGIEMQGTQVIIIATETRDTRENYGEPLEVGVYLLLIECQ